MTIKRSIENETENDQEANNATSSNGNSSLSQHQLKMQKTHYPVEYPLSKKLLKSLSKDLPLECPFTPLLSESQLDCQKRYDTFQKVWSEQELSILKILAGANDSLFTAVRSFITLPVLKDDKLPVGFLQMGSNVANNSRILAELSGFLQDSLVDSNTVLVALDGKSCNNILSAAKSIVKQFCDATGTIPTLCNYDLEIIAARPNTRLVLLLRDSNCISTRVLNQLVSILHACSASTWVRCIFSLLVLDSNTWLAANISRQLRTVVAPRTFAATFDINQEIINRLFLNAKLPLMLDPRLAAILMRRFENATSSVDSLISQVKFCYMIHYYQLPLPSLLHTNQHPNPEMCVVALRRLASFKRHLEIQLSTRAKGFETHIQTLLTSSTAVIALFDCARLTFLKYHHLILESIQLLETLQTNFTHKIKTLHLYTLLASGLLLTSTHMAAMFKELRLQSRDLLLTIADRISQIVPTAGKLLQALSATTDQESVHAAFVSVIKAHLSANSFLSRPITDLVFYEVFTLNGDSCKSVQPQPHLEENNTNLMLETLRPRIRPSLESALDNPQPFISASKNSAPCMPTISHLFRVLKEAPVSINIYDFYAAFRESLDKKAIIDSIGPELDDSQWNKATFAWFLQNCHELMMMGLLREKTKGEILEKALWKGL